MSSQEREYQVINDVPHIYLITVPCRSGQVFRVSRWLTDPTSGVKFTGNRSPSSCAVKNDHTSLSSAELVIQSLRLPFSPS